MGVKVIEGWQAIGKYGYAHWASECLLRDDHKLQLVPQSLFDSWEGYCRCGEWKGVASMYEYDRDGAIAALRQAHALHAAPLPTDPSQE